MTRKQFIESNGATCNNWNWSWSFINEKEKIIIFGAWDFAESGSLAMIFSEEWMFNDKNHKNKGYDQSLHHIKLVEKEGYTLKTFPIYYSGDKKNKNGFGPAKIGGFKAELEDRYLIKIDGKYYASSKTIVNSIPEEVTYSEGFSEGAVSKILINAYERNSEARTKCLEHYGYQCQICNFSFEDFYGELGSNFIHVHHIKPLSEIGEDYKVNPIEDLLPLCPNCHSIIHRTKPALSIQSLKEIIKKPAANTAS